MNIGDKIKNARLQKGMTQEELAKWERLCIGRGFLKILPHTFAL